MVRTRWAAIGAAVAVALGAGGFGFAQAVVGSGEKPVTITIDGERLLDTRKDLGLAGDFVSDQPRDLQVTGNVPVASGGTQTVVPADAVAVIVNATVLNATEDGFMSLRPAGATGLPTTSTVNFTAGSVEPNSATVDLGPDGQIQIYLKAGDTGTADVLLDVVGYTTDHHHDDRYHTEAEVDTALATKADRADTYTKAQVDAAVDAAPEMMFAMVNGDGTIGRQSGGISVAHTPGSIYFITFPRDVTTCGWTATLGGDGGLDGLLTSQQGIAASQGNDLGEPDPDEILVTVWDQDGAPFATEDGEFSLVVICP